MPSKYKYAMICSSNMNRSMEGHKVLHNVGYDVESFGIGTYVRLPGKTEPKVYNFGTKYSDIERDLTKEDEAFYLSKGLLQMVRRNVKIKNASERWQAYPDVSKFDVVVCFQERVFDAVVEDIQCRDPNEFKPIHVINIDTKDTPEDAITGGKDALSICKLIEMIEPDDLEDQMPEIIQKSEEKISKDRLLYSLHYL